MKVIKLSEYIKENAEEQFDEIDILEKANEILNSYQEGHYWEHIIYRLEKDGVNYEYWTDTEILIYYLKNYDV